MNQRTRLLASLIFVCGLNVASSADFEYFLTGSTADVQPQQTDGALLLMGGGGLVDEAFRWFIEKAGGGDGS